MQWLHRWGAERLVLVAREAFGTIRFVGCPVPGGFGLLKATAANPITYRALYQVLRLPKTWRWLNPYGWLAKYPIDAATMNRYIRPVLDRREIRTDGRKAIGGVSARHSRLAAQRLARDFRNPILLTWAAEDHVFPLEHA